MANTREGKVLLRVSESVKRTFGVTGTKTEQCTSGIRNLRREIHKAGLVRWLVQ